MPYTQTLKSHLCDIDAQCGVSWKELFEQLVNFLIWHKKVSRKSLENPK